MIGSPLFSQAVITLDPEYYEGGSFTITAINNSPGNVYVRKLILNGTELDRPYIYHHEITGGGELVFEMGGSPNKSLFEKNQ